MQQPSANRSFWDFSGIFKDELTTQKIIAALNADLNKGQLPRESNDFINHFVMPYLKVAQDAPEQLLKAALNIIYMKCMPDFYYIRCWQYKDAEVKPAIPHYPQAGALYIEWRKCFNEWCDLAKPYVYADGGCYLSDRIDYSTLKKCFLSAIPEDGAVFLPNAKMFIHLQALVRKYIFFEERILKENNKAQELELIKLPQR